MSEDVNRDKVLYQRLKSGDADAREELILGADNLVCMHARMIAFNEHVFDEIKSEGYLELVKCVDRWVFINKSFNAYATKCIKYAMWRYLKRKHKMFNKVEQENILYIDHQDCDFHNSIEVSYEDDADERLVYDEMFEYMCKVLTNRQKQIMHLLYFDDLGPTEIAKKLGVNASNVTTTMKNARERLKAKFNRELVQTGV